MAPCCAGRAMLHDVFSKIGFRVLLMRSCRPAESRLTIKVGGTSNLQHLKYVKNLVDPDNMFTNHQMQGLKPLVANLSGLALAANV